MKKEKNILGSDLQPCCTFPMTGFYRDGFCRTGVEDVGLHTVCVRVTEEFLLFSKAVGNDLSTPHPEYDFPGLIAGDQWCLCALRWKEAYDAGAAPKVVLEATHESALEIALLEQFKKHAADPNDRYKI